MIKQILLVNLLIMLAFSATDNSTYYSSTLFSASDNSFEMYISQNVATPAYTDVVMQYSTISTAIGDSMLSSVICVNTNSSTNLLTATNYTMIAFSFEITCGNPCTNSASFAISEWTAYTDITGTYSPPGLDAFSTTTTVTPVFPTDANVTSNTTANYVNFTYTGMTPANIQSMGLPARNVVAYYRCWGGINYGTTKGYNSATIFMISSLAEGSNFTANGAKGMVGVYQFIGSAILAFTALNMMS